MWISVPIASAAPAGAARDPLLDALGRADPVGDLHDVVRALRVHDDLDARVLGPRGLDVLRAGSAGAPSSGPSRAAAWRP